MADITSEQWKAMLDVVADNERPFFQKLYEDAIHREREAEAAARATSIAEQVALLAVPESNDDRFQEKLAAAIAVLVQLRTLEELEFRVTALEQWNQELQAEIVSLKQSQLSTPRPPNPRPAAVPVSHPNTVLVMRASGTVTSAGTGASSSSGSAGSSALVIVPNAGTSAQNATVLTGVQYSGPVVDKRAATLPSKYDGKGDITSWISSMRSCFEVLRTPQEDRSMIMGTNTEPVVRTFIELQAVTSGYERIDVTEWLKVTLVHTLEDLLITQYQDKHAALKARLKLEGLKGQTWRTFMQALEQHLTGLFTTPNLGLTDVSCMDVVMGVAPKEYVSQLGLKDHTTWRELLTDLVNLEAKELTRHVKAPAAGRTSQRKRYGSGNQLALHEHREAEDQSYADDLSLDDDLEPDSAVGYSASALESNSTSAPSTSNPVVIAVNSRSDLLSPDVDDPPPEVPTNIRRLLDRFPEVLVEPRGVPECPVKHKIEIIEGSVPPKGRVYRMGQGELEELRRQIDDMIDRGWIRPSESEFGAPVLFVPKKGGKLRMCIDYRGLNRITRKNVYPLPRIDDLLDAAGGCKVFSKIGLKSGYHQIEVDPSDQHKTEFKTRDGLYEFIVMPFGLTNAPATFQCLMDKVLRHQLNRFVVIYLDDILIFSKSMEEHVKHLEEVLQVLKEAQLHLNLEKSEFGRDSVIYLGHRLSANDLEPEATKVEVIRKWPQPANARELRSFLGLASYYRKFVPKFYVIGRPLSRLTSKNVAYAWCEKCETAFQALKEALVSHPVLRIADPNLTFVVTTDASQYGIGAVLQQDDGDGLCPLEYYSKRMPSHKVTTSTYMHELYALREALAHCKHHLLGRHFKVYSDHQTLQWIKTQTDLSPTLTRWLHDIDVYNFELKHKKGCYNCVADALSRHPEFLTCLVDSYDLRRKLKEDLVEHTAKDPDLSPILEQLKADPSSQPDFHECEGLVFRRYGKFDRLCVPNHAHLRTYFLDFAHGRSGHFGFEKTYGSLLQQFDWPGMKGSAQKFIVECQVCQRTKVHRHKPYGLLKPLPIPDGPGEKKDEELNTWLRTVPVWVKAKRTLQEEEVITVASYLEGKEAKWLDDVVTKAEYGRRMADWAQSLTLDQFLEMVEARWHNSQQAQLATDAINRLDQRKFKSVRELTTTIDSLIVVPGINYNNQFLLTTLVRCLPENFKNLLASEARLEYHSFETLSRKALDLEATLGNAQPTQNDTRKKKSPQEWKKKGAKLMMVESDGTQTEIDELTDLLDVSEYDGEETAKGSTLAALVKAKHAMNRIFHDHLDKFVVVYLDDILIFSKSVEEHAQHVKTVLSLLRQYKYKVNFEKCEFGRTKILYLGHEVSAEGIRPEDAKMASIRDWPRPQTVTEVRSFLGMCGYYRNFVKNYSTVASPLTDLTRLDTPWDWSDECEGAFKRLKHALMNHEVLMVPDPQKSFIVITDASQYGIGAVLAQQDGKKLRPIEYMSKKMPSKKLAKSTYERELYALYKALVHWRHFLLGRFFYLRTDHQTLKWIKTQPALSDALKRWIEVIDQYDFKLEYLKGEYNKVADALSRRADYLGALVSEFGVSQEVTQSLVGAYQEDPIMMDIMHKLQAKDKATESEFVMVDGLLFLDKVGCKSSASNNWDFLLPENRSSATPGTLEYGVQYEKLLQQAVEHIKKAQQAMIASENKHRRQSSSQVGERVWVKASELGQEFGISRKLMPQYFGHWEVVDVVGDEMDGPTYVICIPGHLRTHPVFHASKLAPFVETDQFPSRRSMLPPTMDGQVDIDDIVDHKDLPVQKPLGRGRPPKPKREYRVRFRHHIDPKEDRWFTRDELIDTAPQVVAEYERMLKGKAPAKETTRMSGGSGGPQKGSSRPMDERKCYKCGKEGHFIWDCAEYWRAKARGEPFVPASYGASGTRTGRTTMTSTTDEYVRRSRSADSGVTRAEVDDTGSLMREYFSEMARERRARREREEVEERNRREEEVRAEKERKRMQREEERRLREADRDARLLRIIRGKMLEDVGGRQETQGRRGKGAAKVYIEYTERELWSRWRENYCGGEGKGKKRKRKLYNWMGKIGVHKYVAIPVFTSTDRKELEAVESTLIRIWSPALNSTGGGEKKGGKKSKKRPGRKEHHRGRRQEECDKGKKKSANLGKIIEFNSKELGNGTVNVVELLRTLGKKRGKKGDRVIVSSGGDTWADGWRLVQRLFGETRVKWGRGTRPLRKCKNVFKAGGLITLRRITEASPMNLKLRDDMVSMFKCPWKNKNLRNLSLTDLLKYYGAMKTFTTKRSRGKARLMISQAIKEAHGMSVRKRVVVRIRFDDRIKKSEVTRLIVVTLEDTVQCFAKLEVEDERGVRLDEVLRVKEKLKGLVLAPLDRNPGYTLVQCPALYAKGMEETFFENDSYRVCEEDEVTELGVAFCEYKKKGLEPHGRWNGNGRIGDAYALPKHGYGSRAEGNILRERLWAYLLGCQLAAAVLVANDDERCTVVRGNLSKRFTVEERCRRGKDAWGGKRQGRDVGEGRGGENERVLLRPRTEMEERGVRGVTDGDKTKGGRSGEDRGGRVVGRWVTDGDKTRGNKGGEDGGDEVRGGEVVEAETGGAVVGRPEEGTLQVVMQAWPQMPWRNAPRPRATQEMRWSRMPWRNTPRPKGDTTVAMATDAMEEHTETKGNTAGAGRVAPAESIVEATKADEEEAANRKGAARVTNGMVGVTKTDEDAGAADAGNEEEVMIGVTGADNEGGVVTGVVRGQCVDTRESG
ncbi:hypothetical protein CBR_g29489 [Chara braunii]|uniref:Reverse transcriptase n=1 Tax=Chara braunii TaxID=69332 RepID=A0A388LAK0_CHABU|nr:hypothetical protein CBR_g29489 [Chara braunii]|eukprot:GBG79339.1 hypothetical protein CBR_g29489 [Chara braunii]